MKRATYTALRAIVLLWAIWQLVPNSAQAQTTRPPIYISFLWHMHQPIYFPGETVNQTASANHYSYNLFDIFNSRTGAYTNWPKDAVQRGANSNLPNFGAQVSFSGSLIENLNNLECRGRGFSNWKSSWIASRSLRTSLNNPRLDLVGFGYHHPLMPLCDPLSIRKQIQKHRTAITSNFTGSYSKGIFTPENAFARHIIPSLVQEGIQWALVDNIHFDRAAAGYPWNSGGNIYQANGADVRNPNPNDWVQLNNLWAPTRNSAAWGRRPHFVQYTDPETGREWRMIAVPADRYLGNEDGRGGFGALSYESVMSQLEAYNTDAQHPILIVLHHDGDNYGGGSDSYYNGNWNNFISWLQANPNRFKCTTVQDYLQMFPPDTADVIHVESGSWAGADAGDPEFKKWNADPSSCYSPDRNSWGVIAAGMNFMQTAWQQDSTNARVKDAYEKALNAQASDYWYWDGSENGIWDSHPTRAINSAIALARPVINRANDATGPYVHLPQREAYNPGSQEYSALQSSKVSIWTYAFDLNGLSSVTLKYRLDNDGVIPVRSPANETYSGGQGVGEWQSIPMTGTYIAARTTPMPSFKAKEYYASILNLNNQLIDYYVEAVDSVGNVTKSVIQHVKVAASNTLASSYTDCGGAAVPIPPAIDPNITPTVVTDCGGVVPPTDTNQVAIGISWIPQFPTTRDTITIRIGGATQAAKLHWGVNGYTLPITAYRPVGSVLFQGTGPAVQTPFAAINNAQVAKIKIGPFNQTAQRVNVLNFVINYADNTWDNNNNANYNIPISLPSAINSPLKNTECVLLPNPAFDKVECISNEGIAQIDVLSLGMRNIYSYQYNDSPNTVIVPLHTLPAGIYICKVQLSNGKTVVQKLVKN